MPVLATVRNTGSHTAHNIFSPYHMHFLTEDRQREPILWFGHCEPEQLPLIDKRMQEDAPLILTMRNPMDVWASWRKRKKAPDHTFVSMWRNLFNLKERYSDSYWLPVDTADRDIYLDAIECRLGLSLNRDWTRKGVFQISYDCDEGMSRDEAVSFFRTLPFERFGYDLDGDSSRN